MTITEATNATAISSADCARRRRRTRALAVVAATAATVTVWTISTPVAGIALTTTTATVTPAAVVLVTAIAGLAAWGSLALLERFTRRGSTAWTWIAVAVLALSLLGPIGSATSTGSAIALVAMHLAAGAVLIPLMTLGRFRA